MVSLMQMKHISVQIHSVRIQTVMDSQMPKKSVSVLILSVLIVMVMDSQMLLK
jgi:hypothetical protein